MSELQPNTAFQQADAAFMLEEKTETKKQPEPPKNEVAAQDDIDLERAKERALFKMAVAGDHQAVSALAPQIKDNRRKISPLFNALLRGHDQTAQVLLENIGTQLCSSGNTARQTEFLRAFAEISMGVGHRHPELRHKLKTLKTPLFS